jgi:hypothetical protein
MPVFKKEAIRGSLKTAVLKLVQTNRVLKKRQYKRFLPRIDNSNNIVGK